MTVVAIVVLAVGFAPGMGLATSAGSDTPPAPGTGIGDRPSTATSDKPAVARVDELVSPTGERTRVYWLTGLLPDGRLVAVSEEDLARMPELGISLEPQRPAPSDIRLTPDAVTGLFAEGGSISGTVRDAAGQPVAGAHVCAYAGRWESAGERTQTDALGNYYLSGLAPGLYRVWAEASGHASTHYGQTPWWAYATAVCVTTGATSSDIDITLARAGSITATVTDSNGTPLPNVSVMLDTPDYSCSTLTNADGVHVFSDLPLGYAYTLGSPSRWWRQPGDGDWIARTSDIFLAAANPDVSVTLPLAGPGGKIQGCVLDAGGNPIVDADVYADSMSGSWVTSTDADGNYTLRGLASGTYDVYVYIWGTSIRYQARPDPVAVVAPETTAAVDFVFRENGVISGTVRNNLGNPLAGVSVQVKSESWTLDVNMTVITDSAGYYEATGLSLGDYLVCAPSVARSGPADGDRMMKTSRVWVTVDSDATANFDLPPGGSISGTVRDAAQNSLAGATVLCQWSGEGSWLWPQTQTDAEGGYTLRGLPSGDFFIEAGLTGYVSSSWTWVRVEAPGAITGTDINLEPAGVIRGTITADCGLALSSVDVVAEREDGAWYQGWGYSDSAGCYSIEVPAGGTYSVGAPDWWSWSMYDFGWIAQRVSSITLAPGAPPSATVDFSLTQGGTIVGTVRDAKGHPVIEINIIKAVSRLDGAVMYGYAWNENGVCGIKGLASGDYAVFLKVGNDAWAKYPGWVTVQAPFVTSYIDFITGRVVISETGGKTCVTEGGASDTYTVVLATQPTGTVTVAATADGQVTVNGVSTVSLVFTTSNWNVPKIITVRAVDDTLVEGTHYGIITHTVSDAGPEGASAPQVSVEIIDNDLPVAPRSLAATTMADGVRLTWQPPASGPAPTGYEVYINTATTGTFTKVKDVASTLGSTQTLNLSAADCAAVGFTLTGGQTYYFQVKSDVDLGAGQRAVSKPSNTASAVAGPVPPLPPRSLTGAATATGLRLGWLPALTGCAPQGYQVFIAPTTTGPFTLVKEVTSWAGTAPNCEVTQLDFTDGGGGYTFTLVGGKRYAFQVRGFILPSAGGTLLSKASNTATVTAGPLPPLAPTGLAARTTLLGVGLGWRPPLPTATAPTPPTGYSVYIAATSAGPWTFVKDVTTWTGDLPNTEVTGADLAGTGFTMTGGLRYSFRVFSFITHPLTGQKVPSLMGATTMGVAGPLPPLAPTSLRGTTGADGFGLTWLAPLTGVTPQGYEVWLATTSMGSFSLVKDVTTWEGATPSCGVTSAEIAAGGLAYTPGARYSVKLYAYALHPVTSVKLVSARWASSTVTAGPLPPQAPTSLVGTTALPASGGGVNLTWKPPLTGAVPAGYALHIAAVSTGPYTFVRNVTSWPGIYPSTQVTAGDCAGVGFTMTARVRYYLRVYSFIYHPVTLAEIPSLRFGVTSAIAGAQP